MTPTDIFEMLCALLSRKGRGAGLMGNSMPLALEAFSRCLMDDAVPTVWFEFPLLGRPCFDLHVVLSHETLSRCKSFPPSIENSPFKKALEWFREHSDKDSGGAAFAFDLSGGRTDSHGLHFLNKNISNIDHIFAALEAPDAPELLRSFLHRIPYGWRMWYWGLLPGREGRPVRADFYVDESLKARYLESPALFASHLEKAGLAGVSQVLPARMKELAEFPFPLELQFDLLKDGSLSPTLSLSANLRYNFAKGKSYKYSPLPPEEKQLISELFTRMEALGLSDDRWRLFLDSFFAKRFTFDTETLELVHIPIFLKQKFRNGVPLNAKVYSESYCKKHLLKR